MADVERSPEEIARIKAEIQKQRDAKREEKLAKKRADTARARGGKVVATVSRAKVKEVAKVEAAGAESRAESALPEYLSGVSKQIKTAAESDRETLGKAKDVSLGVDESGGGVVANIDTSADDGQNSALSSDSRTVGRGQKAGGASAEDIDNMHQTASLYAQFAERKLNVQPTSSSVALQHAADLIDNHASSMGENKVTQKIHDHVEKAQWHIDQHEAAHNEGDHETALGHITKAADHIRQAAKGFGEGFRIESPIGRVRPSNWTDSAVAQYAKEHGVRQANEVKGPSKSDLTLGQEYSAPLTAGEAGRQAQIDAGETIGSNAARSNKTVPEGWMDKEVEKVYNKKPVPKSVDEENPTDTGPKELAGGVNTSTRIRLATGTLKPEEEAGVRRWQESYAPSKEFGSITDWTTEEGLAEHRQRLEGLLATRLHEVRAARETSTGTDDPYAGGRAFPSHVMVNGVKYNYPAREMGPRHPQHNERQVEMRAQVERATIGQGPLQADAGRTRAQAMDLFEKENGPRPTGAPNGTSNMTEEERAPFAGELQRGADWQKKYTESGISENPAEYVKKRTNAFTEGQAK